MDRWLDKFIETKLVKIAKDVRASYIEQLARIFEGKLNTKYSSVDEALDDFASRLGLQASEVALLKKEALAKVAQKTQSDPALEKLKDHGITDPKAIRFMSKSKHKHTQQTSSPFAINQQQGDQLAEKLKQQQQDDHETPKDENQQNELTKSGTLRIADLPKKVFPFEQPSFEQIVKELQERKPIKQYRTARTAFKFRSIDRSRANFPVEVGSPIAVTIYAFAFHKDKVIDFITKDLLKILSSELKPTEWAQKVQHFAKEVDRPVLLERLNEINELLKKEHVDINKKDKMIEFIKLLPISYQDEVLKLLASGYYKHLIPEASGRTHAYVFSSRYEQSTFVLMKSFAPYKQLAITEKSKEKLGAFLTGLLSDENKQALKAGQQVLINLSFDQARDLLDKNGTEYKEVAGVEDESESNFLGGRLKVNIESQANKDYQPLVLEKSIKDPKQQEQMAAELTNAIHEASRANIPLAFEAKDHEGVTSYEGKSLGDLTLEQTNFLNPTIEKDKKVIQNPLSGLHPTYKGTVPKPKTPLTGPQLPKLSETIINTIKKYAQQFELWLDDEGRTFQNEEQLRNLVVKEIMLDLESEVVNEAVSKVLQTIGSSPSTIPSKLVEQPIPEAELLASSILTLTKIALKLEDEKLIKLLLNKKHDKN